MSAASKKKAKKVRLSLAPLALTSTGELLINAAEFSLLTSFERALRAAKKSGLPIFVGLVLPARESTEAMKAIDDAAADVAGNVGGRIQGRIFIGKGRTRT